MPAFRSRSEILRRLAANHPEDDSVWLQTQDCAEYAVALRGNTHVRQLELSVSFEDEEGSPLEDALTSWRSFCQAVQEMSSLQELEICIADENPTPQHFHVVGLLLKYFRQAKSIYLKTDHDPINNSVYGRVLARTIVGHPSLERFRLEDFECGSDGSSLAAVLEALISVPNLESFCLDPMFDGYSGHFFRLAGECNGCLGRLMRKSSLARITFRHFDFTHNQVKTIAEAIESPESQPQQLGIERCRMPVDSAQSLFGSISGKTSLWNLYLHHIVLSGFDVADHADLLGPLFSSTSLSEMHLALQVPTSWPRFSSLQTNVVLQNLQIDLASTPATSAETVASLFLALGTNQNEHSNVRFLTILGLDFNANHKNVLAPLAANRNLEELHIIQSGQVGYGDGLEWPRFDFLRENQTLLHLILRIRFAMPGDGFDSLCQALHLNSTLKILNLVFCGLNDDHITSLASMISANVGLEKLLLNSNHFKREGLLSILPSLVGNASVQVLEIVPTGTMPDNPYENTGTDAFARGALSQTNLRELQVGPWDGDDAKPILIIAAKNYHIERLEFHYSNPTTEYQILEGTIDAITRLNKAGRGYLGDRSRGPECKAAGVNVLSKVSNDLDCIFYHLRENPLLCGHDKESGGEAGKCGTPTQPKRGNATMSRRSSKKHRSVL